MLLFPYESCEVPASGARLNWPSWPVGAQGSFPSGQCSDLRFLVLPHRMPDGIDGMAFVRLVGSLLPVQPLHGRFARVMERHEGPVLLVEYRASGASGIGRRPVMK